MVERGDLAAMTGESTETGRLAIGVDRSAILAVVLDNLDRIRARSFLKCFMSGLERSD